MAAFVECVAWPQPQHCSFVLSACILVFSCSEAMADEKSKKGAALVIGDDKPVKLPPHLAAKAKKAGPKSLTKEEHEAKLAAAEKRKSLALAAKQKAAKEHEEHVKAVKAKGSAAKAAGAPTQDTAPTEKPQ